MQRVHLSLPRPLIPMTRAITRKRVPGSHQHVVVIGAGLSGLAAAAKLRASGHDVTVLEAADQVGGRCRTEILTSEHGEFEADTGATVLTMPSLFEGLVHGLGQHLPEWWAPRRLAPGYHAQFASGRSINVFSDPARMEQEIRRFSREKFGTPERGVERGGHRDARMDATTCEQPTASTNTAANEYADPEAYANANVAGFRSQRAWSQEMFGAAFEHFLAADFDSVADLVSTPAAATELVHLAAIGAFGSLARATGRHIKDDELQRLFTFQALYAGESPASARAVYSVISHMDTTMGVFYPRHSIGEASELLAGALREAGVSLQLCTPVTALESSNDHITGVRVADGRVIATDAVISTVDLPILERIVNGAGGDHGNAHRDKGKRTERSRSQGAAFQTLKERVLPLRWSPSALVIHGTVPTEVADAFPSRAHHTLSFGAQWEEVFQDITAGRSKGRLMRDPSLLITRPAVSAPTRVRSSSAGSYEPLSILAPVPNLNSAPIAWDSLTDPYVHELVGILEQRGWTGIADHFSIARVDSPATWQHRDGFGAGSPFSLAHSFSQTGPLRPKNYPAYGFDNLVLAGAGTTPGVGVPTVVLSGALAARRITGGGVR